MRDPAAIASLPPYIGFFSNLGIFALVCSGNSMLVYDPNSVGGEQTGSAV